MHLVGPYMTTTKYNRKQKKSKSRRLAAAEAEHDKWLRSKGVHPDQLAEKKAKRKDVKTMDVSSYIGYNANRIHTSDCIPSGSTAPKERNVYSGERRLLGIATMHKSNMVPVFADKKDDAKDIAKMGK